VVRDLEQVHPWQSARDQLRIDLLLDVTREQETSTVDLPEEHDRDVVDAGPRVGRLTRHLTGARPQDGQLDLVDREAVTRSECRSCGSVDEGQPEPGRVPGTRSAHPRLERPPDAVPVEEQREPGDVILVRMGEHDRVQPSVPRRHAPVELDEEALGVRAAVDEDPPAGGTLDEDRVALPDI
jgi:hypothetical protein